MKGGRTFTFYILHYLKFSEKLSNVLLEQLTILFFKEGIAFTSLFAS